MAINGGPQFQFTEAVSFNLSCKDQDEVDRLWSQLTADGGWRRGEYVRLAEGPVRSELADHPERMGELLSDLDPGRSQRLTRVDRRMANAIPAITMPRHRYWAPVSPPTVRS